jgi:geranylgeranyl pyrophosphate synthase
VHDDIEDEDDLRYGEAPLHAEFGVPIALNAGVLILGHGYRLIGVCGAPPERIVAMLQNAADGHRALCEGQGAELAWQHHPVPLGVDAVLDIFSKKTAPAFDVALKLGAIYAGADDATLNILGRYSRLLGIAYQIRDDLDDFGEQAESNDLRGHRPSLLMALAYDRSSGDDRDLLNRLWQRDVTFDHVADAVYDIYNRLDVPAAARRMLHQHRNEAVRILRELRDPTLRGLLRRVLSRIFPQV